jgi:hypothetical protein
VDVPAWTLVSVLCGDEMGVFVQRNFDRYAVSKAKWLVLPALMALSTNLTGCDAYNKGFNQAFDKSLHDSCVKSAVANSAPADAAERYCSCMVGQLQGLSAAEKQSLNPSSDKVRAAADHCKASIAPATPAAPT